MSMLSLIAVEVIGADPAPYSIEKMRHTLEMFIRYCAEQDLIETPLALEELFVTGLDSEVQCPVDRLAIDSNRM